LILEHSVVSVEIFGRLWPVLHIAFASNSRPGIERRAAKVGFWVCASSSSFSACAANEFFLHRIICNRAQDVRMLANLICIVDSCTDAQAIGSIWFLEGELRRADSLVEGARGRAAVEFAKVRVVNFDEGASDGSEMDVETVAIHIAEVVKIWPA
jgi:hypothetical protein